MQIAVAHLADQQRFEARDRGRDLRVGRHRRGIDHAELRPPVRDALAAVFAHRDRHVDAGDVMRIVARLDQRAAAVVIDEQVVRVAGEQQFGGARVLQLDRVAAIAMQHRADEIRAFLAQCRRLRLGGRRSSSQSADPPARTCAATARRRCPSARCARRRQ